MMIDEMAAFNANPRNLEILGKIPKLMDTQFIAEIIEAHGCA